MSRPCTSGFPVDHRRRLASCFSQLYAFCVKPFVPPLHNSKPMGLQNGHVLAPWKIVGFAYMEGAVIWSGHDVGICANVRVLPSPALAAGCDSNDIDKREMFILHELIRVVALNSQIMPRDARGRIRGYTMN